MSWFEDWFNSPYYALLYNNRDGKEATAFIKNLLNYLKPVPGSRIADIPCGNGRHAIALEDAGFDVTAFDLSEHNIDAAKPFEKDNLSFYQHDMRQPFHIHYFDYIMNLFTSLGYFNADYEDVRVLKNFQKALKPEGVLVVDFFNSNCVINQMKKNYVVEKEGVRFEIEKHYDGRLIHKIIKIYHPELKETFVEKVRAYTKQDLEKMLNEAGFIITKIFGSYELKEYDAASSERIIILAKRNS